MIKSKNMQLFMVVLTVFLLILYGCSANQTSNSTKQGIIGHETEVTKAPNTGAPTSIPKDETPNNEAPAATPKVDTPTNDTPADIPKVETPSNDNPKSSNLAQPNKKLSEKSTVSTTGLSNTKKGWGLKRNKNHAQPEVPSSITSTLNKYGAYWIGKPDEKVVYLTFDEGYEKGYSGRILDILKANDVKAAFFVTGYYLKSQPDLIKRMSNEGHIVGNHTNNHPSMPEISDEQIKNELQVVETRFEEITGRKDMKYLRPPKGEYSERTLAVTKDLGYNNIFWSMALVDWIPMKGGPQEAYKGVMDNLHNGALILLHAVSQDDTEALDGIIKDIKAQGYSFKTLDDLVQN